MRILVTGGAGFIGSHVVDRMVELGHEVVVVDNLRTGRRQYVNPAARFYAVDIQDAALFQIFERERPHLVNHHAAQASVRASVEDSREDAAVNILGSINLLECCRRYGVEKVIYASTGGAIYGEPRYLPCPESHPAQPLSPYGASKYAVEHYLHVYHKLYGLDYTILRYANVYGPRQDPLGEAGVVAIFAGAMLKGKEVVIFGSGQQERDFVFIDDVVEANILCLERGSGGIYNIGTGKGTSINHLFSMMKELTGYQGEAVKAPPRPGEVFKIALDPSRAARELAWSPRIPLEEGLRHTVDYLRAPSRGQRRITGRQP